MVSSISTKFKESKYRYKYKVTQPAIQQKWLLTDIEKCGTKDKRISKENNKNQAAYKTNLAKAKADAVVIGGLQAGRRMCPQSLFPRSYPHTCARIYFPPKMHVACTANQTFNIGSSPVSYPVRCCTPVEVHPFVH